MNSRPRYSAKSRVPVDDAYAALVGKAVYVFAYYEWIIIYIIEQFQRDFVREYCRVEVMMSGKVRTEFQRVIDDPMTDFSKISKHELQASCDEFKRLIVRRNALIHAHPCTDKDGSQILNYQTIPTRGIPDMKWSKGEVETIIGEFDRAACSAAVLFDKIRRTLA